jgi:GNAT superfamily N-acetyltransferase
MPDPNWAVEDFYIEPLSTAHDRSAFSCGNAALDRYFRTFATQDLRKRVSAVFVMTPNSRVVAGFYTLSQSSVLLHSLPDPQRTKLPKYPHVPATLLGRLAVDLKFQKLGLGRLLLFHAFRNCITVAANAASAVLLVDAKDNAARRFYERHGFQSLSDGPGRLFISLAIVEKLLQIQD